MREILSDEIKNAVSELCIKANNILPSDIVKKIEQCYIEETGTAKAAMSDLVENIKVAKEKNLPVCQDTGMAVIFVDIGREVYIKGDILYKAINDGVSDGYNKGYLRKSIVRDPLRRVNTDDNTPAIIHTNIVEGDKIKITVAPKGFGSENMGALKMFNPSADKNDIIDFVVETVLKAGSKPCPPIVVGVGIGGNFEYSAFLAKKALLKSIDERNADNFYAEMETELLNKINETGIGPQGYGGKNTALGVNIETFPTHIAGLPVAVNISCHVTRHCSIIL